MYKGGQLLMISAVDVVDVALHQLRVMDFP